MIRTRSPVLFAIVILIAAIGYGLLHRARVQQRHDDERTAREAALHEALYEMREAIRRFHAENGRYPTSLGELVPAHLDAIPVDPMTGSTSTWRTITEETVVPSSDFALESVAPGEVYILGVHSGAGSPWSDY